MNERELEDFEAWYGRHETEELIGALLRRARDSSRAELEKLWAKLPEVEPPLRRQIGAAVGRIVNRIMHEPIEALKAESHAHSPVDFTRIIRNLCRLDEYEQTEDDAS